jgi:hypothetical protein
MKATNEFRKFATDEQILECLILFETRKMDAAKLLSAYVAPKWGITTLEAVAFLKKMAEELNQPTSII